jgi:cobalt-zinc-cadmium efflux system outer membrane protein
MRARFVVPRRGFGALLVAGALVLPASLGAQGATRPAPVQTAPLSMADAVRLALDRNQALRAQRLTVDESKADEITAALKPNWNFSFALEGLEVFTPSHFTFNTTNSNVTYDVGTSHTFERGGKRDKRTIVAQGTTDVTLKGVMDAERQLRFQAEQAFIGVLLAKSLLEAAQANLTGFSEQLDINEQRVKAGDLAEGDFLPIKIQKLQFETDLSAAELGLIQAKASLRQLVGYDSIPDEFDVTGELASEAPAVILDDLKRDALVSRPDLLAAQSSLKLAKDSAELAKGNRARDVTGGVDYLNVAGANTIGGGFSFDLPFGDRNQGNIAHADIAVRQAIETEAATRIIVLTDVVNAFAAFQTSEKVVKLYESGYLDQARQSLEITSYAFQRGATTLSNLLDAQRTNRDIQLAYRQALATLMTNARQLNLVVGKQVIK